MPVNQLDDTIFCEATCPHGFGTRSPLAFGRARRTRDVDAKRHSLDQQQPLLGLAARECLVKVSRQHPIDVVGDARRLVRRSEHRVLAQDRRRKRRRGKQGEDQCPNGMIRHACPYVWLVRNAPILPDLERCATRPGFASIRVFRNTSTHERGQSRSTFFVPDSNQSNPRPHTATQWLAFVT
ncbi:MAG: hypothetical protein ACI89X_000306 [Planctomycetota bacterium]|jgi:hypothetical protein